MGPLRGVLSSDNLTTNRIEAFSDGVFAIVVTLLVLEFRVPQVHGENVSSALLTGLVHLLPKLLSYAMSFIIVIIFWVSHHSLFHIIRHSNRGLLWFNSLFLMVLAFVPFPTALIGEYPGERVAVMFFGLVMTAVGFSFCVMRWYVSYGARLLEPTLDAALIRHAMRRSLLSPVFYGSATLLALWSTQATMVLYLVIPIFYFLPGKLESHGRMPDQ